MNLKWIALMLISAMPVFSKESALSYQKASCLTNPQLQVVRSEELKKLAAADQHDRGNWDKLSPKQLGAIGLRDLKRRIRVGKLFAEGCFKSADDYAAGALIYQHGNVPDHYFQAFSWSYRGVLLGDERQKHMMALAIDRYLVSIGKKQLFGSQYSASSTTDKCFCMRSVEQSFPDEMRQFYLGQSLSAQYARLISLNAGKNNCPYRDCPQRLDPSPKGTVPGFW